MENIGEKLMTIFVVGGVFGGFLVMVALVAMGVIEGANFFKRWWKKK